MMSVPDLGHGLEAKLNGLVHELAERPAREKVMVALVLVEAGAIAYEFLGPYAIALLLAALWMFVLGWEYGDHAAFG